MKLFVCNILLAFLLSKLYGCCLSQVNDGSNLSGIQVVVEPSAAGFSLLDEGQITTGGSAPCSTHLEESFGRETTHGKDSDSQSQDAAYKDVQLWPFHRLHLCRNSINFFHN